MASQKVRSYSSAQGKQEPITPDNNNNNKNRKIMREENKTDFAS